MSIFYESEMCLSSLQVNVSERAHFSDDDERAVQVCLKMKEMSMFLCRFISLNSGVFYTLRSIAVPPFHLSVLTHRYSEPHLAVRSQSPLAQWSLLHPETSTNRITMMLKGLWWVNWDKSAAFYRGCCGVAPHANSFPCRKSHSQHSDNRQMNALQNAVSHSHLNKLKVKSAWFCFKSVGYGVFFLTVTDVLRMVNWERLDGSGCVLSCYYFLCVLCFVFVWGFFFALFF